MLQEQAEIGTELINTTCLTGRVINLPKYRVSPAGLETAHFKLWHESLQEQDYGKLDLKHKVEFTMPVSVARQGLINKLKEFTFDKVRVNKIWLEVSGYLAYRKFSNGEQHVVLHASNIKLLDL